MTDRAAVQRWIESYLAAARTDDRERIESLFADDALYFDGPFGEPWKGHDQIVAQWVAQSDAEYEFEVDHRVVAVDGAMGVAEIEYRYTGGPGTPRTYRNVWLLELDDGGRAKLFKDYWIEEPGSGTAP